MTQTTCSHMNGYSINHVEAMGCESWYYQCEECGTITTQVVEYPTAQLNRFHLWDGPVIDWVRTERIYREIVAA